MENKKFKKKRIPLLKAYCSNSAFKYCKGTGDQFLAEKLQLKTLRKRHLLRRVGSILRGKSLELPFYAWWWTSCRWVRHFIHHMISVTFLNRVSVSIAYAYDILWLGMNYFYMENPLLTILKMAEIKSFTLFKASVDQEMKKIGWSVVCHSSSLFCVAPFAQNKKHLHIDGRFKKR